MDGRVVGWGRTQIPCMRARDVKLTMAKDGVDGSWTQLRVAWGGYSSSDGVMKRLASQRTQGGLGRGKTSGSEMWGGTGAARLTKQASIA